MKQKPYSWEDASYLTRRSLGVPSASWRDIGNDTVLPVIFLMLLLFVHCYEFTYEYWKRVTVCRYALFAYI